MKRIPSWDGKSDHQAESKPPHANVDPTDVTQIIELFLIVVSIMTLNKHTKIDL